MSLSSFSFIIFSHSPHILFQRNNVATLTSRFRVKHGCLEWKARGAEDGPYAVRRPTASIIAAILAREIPILHCNLTMQRVKLNGGGERNWEISIERIPDIFLTTPHHFKSPSSSTQRHDVTRRVMTSYSRVVCNFVQVFRWRAVKSGTDDDSFKTRYKRSGNGLSTIIVDPLKHLLDACSRGFEKERERERAAFFTRIY